MIPYSPLQLLFFFFVYCFIGWIIESTWVSLHQHRFVNRGFMRGPFIPIYGFGAMALLLVGTPLLKWPVAVFFGGLLAASILEYITGTLMEAIFKVRYWDYTGKFMNINGHVCLFTSVCWGFLAMVEDYVIHKPIEALSNYMTTKELNLIVAVITIYFTADVTLSFKAAFDMRAIIIKMEKAKDELRLMQKRLDVMLAYMDADKDEFIEESKDKAEGLYKGIETKFEVLKKQMEEKPSMFAENVKEELKELKEKYAYHKEESDLRGFKGFYNRGLILGNPTMVSKKFKDSFETIRDYVNDKKK